MRIVSLLPSLTEIVCALGEERSLVARSHECDHPASVRALPALTAPRFVAEGSSVEIDERVKALLEAALSVYHVDAERLAALLPDVILTQSQCEVCAVSVGDVEAAVATMAGRRPRTVSLAPERLADLWSDVRRVAAALEVAAAGEALVARLEARVAEVSRAAHAATDHEAARPTVATIEWIAPLMAAGNWVPELIELAGGVSLFGTAGQHSPWMKWRELVASDPDVLVVMPCGFDLPRTRVELAALIAEPGWAELRAVRAGRVYLTDGNQYFNRPGPRLVESLEILAEILHPSLAYGHRGRGFESL